MKKGLRLRLHWRNNVVVDEWVDIFPDAGDMVKFKYNGEWVSAIAYTPEWVFDENYITINIICKGE